MQGTYSQQALPKRTRHKNYVKGILHSSILFTLGILFVVLFTANKSMAVDMCEMSDIQKQEIAEKAIIEHYEQVTLQIHGFEFDPKWMPAPEKPLTPKIWKELRNES